MEEKCRIKHCLQLFSALKMRDSFFSPPVLLEVSRGWHERGPPLRHLGWVALTNGLGANGRREANQENLDPFSVSHSVRLFSDFSWGQLWYKQMDFKVVGLNKSLHDILMIQVFWDCKTGLKVSEGIYFCFLGQAEIQEIDLVQFFCLIFCLFFSTLWLRDAFALIRENKLP